MNEPRVRPVAAADRPTIERLWQLFVHDLSEFRGTLPGLDGAFATQRLRPAFEDPGWAAHLVTSGDHGVGLAIVRGLDGPVRVMNAFFIVRGARRTGISLPAVRQVLAHYPGRWEIPFQDNNTIAARFWQRVAQDVAPDAWTREHRPVPNRPDVPPDTWICFTAP